MPANVESMFWQGEVPWHGLGTEIPEGKRLSVDEALVAAGCDWEVGKLPLVIASTDDVPEAMRGRRVRANCTYRMTDEKVLGDHVGDRYTLYQNRKAFEWFQPFLDKNEAEFHTAGSLNDGKTVWVLAKINRDPMVITKGDEVQKYLLLHNNHDGLGSAGVGFCPIRVVCVNTLALAKRDKNSKLLRVRHTPRIVKGLEMVRDTVDVWNQTFEATAEQYRFLAQHGVNTKDLDRYVKTVLGVADKKPDEISGQKKTLMAYLVQAFESPKGGNPARGTWWQAYNAFTQYWNFEASRNSNNRLRELWYGTVAKDSAEALAIALQMAS